MGYEHPWLVLWVGSGLVQLAGLGMAGWSWWRTTQPGWRAFWFAFVLNWCATVAHHGIWGVSTELALPIGFLQGVMKLAAMLAEIALMLIAQDLERPGEGRW